MEKIELEQENKLLKSYPYCTKKSCVNCGYVNCENFQRQRKNCCERWISFKDYIVELEGQIEKMKCCFNCKHSRTEYEHCKTDKREKWEIKENE